MATLTRTTNSSISSEEALFSTIVEATKHSFALEGINLSEEELLEMVHQESKRLEKRH
jgi:hypothetical protein